MKLDEVFSAFTPVHAMYAILGLIAVAFVYYIYKLSLDDSNTLELSDLITDNGRLSETKITRFGAWLVSTWGFIYLMVLNPEKFPDWYFMAYMGAWVANALINKSYNIKEINNKNNFKNDIEDDKHA